MNRTQARARSLAQQVRPRAAETPMLFAIDGRCASGKTTLARQLAQVLSCPVFHMDDFFLPPALRTPERMARPGENVHHERFLEEVLRPFAAGSPVSLRPFQCDTGTFAPAVTVSAAPFAIVEGSYALHPSLREFYAASVFLTCSPQEQLARLAARCPAKLTDFQTKWIPLEEQYFRACHVPEAAGLVLDTTEDVL